MIKNVFSALGNKYRNEGEMQREIIPLIGRCYPLLPKDSVSTIEAIIT